MELDRNASFDLARGGLGYPPHEIAAMAWLAGYENLKTVNSYKLSIRVFFEFCAENQIDPLRARRVHLDLWARTLEKNLKPRTVALRLTAVASWYIYCAGEGLVDATPMVGVRRPRIERRSPTGWLNRTQLCDLVAAAAHLGPHPHALVSILAFNGLRIGETCALNIDDLSTNGFYPVLLLRNRKGGKSGQAVLSRPTESAVDAAIGGRDRGPLLLTEIGTRMNQHAAQRILDKCRPALRGELPRRITPHVLRHSWTTMALEARVPPDQIQHDGGWSDPRLLTYYGHGQDAPVKAASHAVAAFVQGAA